MELETGKFGRITIADDKIFKFVMPVVGFDELSTYALLEHSEESIFMWLQSVENSLLAFPVFSCSNLQMDYVVDLPDSVVEALQIESVEDLLVMNIASIPSADPTGATINLLAPIVLNVKNKLAGQVILSGSGYEVKYPLFEKGESV